MITPFVDFTSLDLVGVVAAHDVKSDRTVIRADGTTRPPKPERQPLMSAVRALVLTGVLLLAVVLQVAVFSVISVDGVVPNLALLVVVAAALMRGPEFAAMLGFLGGLAIDLAPPSDHVAGRWALALVVVGYLAGRVRHDAGIVGAWRR